MLKKLIFLLACGGLAGMTLPASALAQNAVTTGQPTAAQGEFSTATIRKLDAATGKLTLQHGPLKNLGMPAMTMVFKAKDRAALGKLQEGDRIRFVAEQSGADILASRIEKVN